jgi:hypothetical protein
MEGNKRKQYFIVKEEPTQSGGQIFFRYYVPGMFPRDPSAVGLFASPMMNRPPGMTDSFEIARSIGKIRAPAPNVTFPGRLAGSPFPGTVTLPNRPVIGMATMGPCGHPACQSGPCRQQCAIPGFGVVPIRKGSFTPGVWGPPSLIRGAPYFPYGYMGLSAAQEAIMTFTIGPIKYKVILPYGEVNNICQILNRYETPAEASTVPINVNMPSCGWTWPFHVRSTSLTKIADIFVKLQTMKDVKFLNEVTNQPMTVDQVRSSLISYVKTAGVAAATKSEEEKRKLSEVESKLTGTEDERMAAELEKRAAEIRAKVAARGAPPAARL